MLIYSLFLLIFCLFFFSFVFFFVFFFFSSRRRHTRCSRDWSSDVCSSDLPAGSVREPVVLFTDEVARQLSGKPSQLYAVGVLAAPGVDQADLAAAIEQRSEERRVGKSVDLGGRRSIKKKKKRKHAKNDEEE